MTVRHLIRTLIPIALLGLSAGCSEPSIELEMSQPQVAVVADEVRLEGRVRGPAAEAITVRYTVRTASEEPAVVTRGRLELAEDGRFAAVITPDMPGLYTIELEASAPGQAADSLVQDFLFRYPPPPTPRLDGPDPGQTVYGPAAPHPQLLRIGTRAGLRIEVMRGQSLLARTLATSDNVEVTVELHEGENAFRLIALDDRSSAEQQVDLTLVVGEEPPAVAGAGDAVAGRGEADGLPRGGGRSKVDGSPTGGRSPTPRRDEREDVDRRRIALDAGLPSDAIVDMELPPMVDAAAQEDPVDAAQVATEQQLDDACRRGDGATVIAIRQGAKDVAMTPVRSLCVARALMSSGDCQGASSLAHGLLDREDEAGPARLVLARCAGAGSDAASEHLAKLVELHLDDRSGVTSDILLGAVERARLPDAQRRRVAAPCRDRRDEPLCAALVPPDIATLCAEGRSGEAAEAHREGSDPAPRDRRCVAEGHIAAGRLADGLKLLEQILDSTASGQTAGEVGLLVAAHSRGARRDKALGRVIGALADTTYRTDDIGGLASVIREAAPNDAAGQARLVSACRDVAERPACKALLEALSMAPATNGRIRVRFERDGCRATIDGRDGALVADGGRGASADLPPGTHIVRFGCDGAEDFARRSVEIKAGETLDVEQPAPPAPRSKPPTSQHQIEVDPPDARFSLDIGGASKPLSVRAGRIEISPEQAGIGARSYRLEANGSTVTGMVDIERVMRKSLPPVKLHVPAPKARHPFSVGVEALSKGKWPDAIRALKSATAEDPRMCIAWAYLGYAQAMSGAHAVAGGSFERCSGSLTNDTEGVTTARVLQAVVRLQRRLDGSPAKTLEPLVQQLGQQAGSIAVLKRLLPESARAPIQLRSMQRYWLAVGRARLYEKLKDEGAPAAGIEKARSAALEAWDALPETRSGVGPGRVIQTRTAFAEERALMLRKLQAAGTEP